MLRPLLERSSTLPPSLPPIDLSDIDEDAEVAKRIMNSYKKNLPAYLQQDVGEVFNFQERWETPPLSTEMRIMGTKIDNTKDEVVRAIRGIAKVGAGVVK